MLFLNPFNLGVARLEEQARTAGRLSLVFLQLDGLPVYLVRTLCQGRVRDDAALADEDDGRNVTCLNGLIATVIHLARLIVYPLALGQVDGAAVATLQEWCHEHL